MPPVNIPDRVRFWLYCAGVVGVPGIDYAVERGWAGPPEQTLVNSLAAFLLVLAAANTPAAQGLVRRLRKKPTDTEES